MVGGSHISRHMALYFELLEQYNRQECVSFFQALRSADGFCSSSVSDSLEGDCFYFIGITGVRDGTAG